MFARAEGQGYSWRKLDDNTAWRHHSCRGYDLHLVHSLDRAVICAAVVAQLDALADVYHAPELLLAWHTLQLGVAEAPGDGMRNTAADTAASNSTISGGRMYTASMHSSSCNPYNAGQVNARTQLVQ